MSETRSIEEIDASLWRNNRHRTQALAARDFFAVVEDWSQVEKYQKDVVIYDNLNDRFLDERLYARSLEVSK